jgi:hypothetical protein
MACLTGKMVIQEQRSTLVGEDHGDTGEVGAETGEEVGGYGREEGHVFCFLKYIVYR